MFQLLYFDFNQKLRQLNGILNLKRNGIGFDLDMFVMFNVGPTGVHLTYFRMFYLVWVSLIFLIEPRHEIFNNMVCATSNGSDHPAHTRSLIRAVASRLTIL